MKLAINLATRGRPELACSTAQRTLSNIQNPETSFMISVDEDDIETYNALKKIYSDHNEFPAISFSSREDSLGAKFNRVLYCFPDADIYMIACDDGPHITPGFDNKILSAAKLIPDRYFVVTNHLENMNFSSIQAVSRGFIDKMDNKLWPEYFPYWFGDHWIMDVARMCGRLVFVDIYTDHSNVPATQGRRDEDFWSEVYVRLAPERERQARSIILAQDFLDPFWKKQLLTNNFPLTTELSTAVNLHVAMLAGDPATAGTAPDNERHQRLREAAEKLVGPITRWNNQFIRTKCP